MSNQNKRLILSKINDQHEIDDGQESWTISKWSQSLNIKRFKELDSTSEQLNKEQDTLAQPLPEGYKFSRHRKQMSKAP